MFIMGTNSPSTLLPSITPSIMPTLRPSTIHPTIRGTYSPSFLPTATPSINPTAFPTEIPTAPLSSTTISPSSISASLSSSSTKGSTQGQSLSIIISSVLIFVVLVLLVGVCVYVRKNNSKSPYSKWIQHYAPTNAPTLQRADNVDIHHFYNKSANATPFTPHISENDGKRYSKSRLSIHQSYRNDQRRASQDQFSI